MLVKIEKSENSEGVTASGAIMPCYIHEFNIQLVFSVTTYLQLSSSTAAASPSAGTMCRTFSSGTASIDDDDDDHDDDDDNDDDDMMMMI